MGEPLEVEGSLENNKSLKINTIVQPKSIDNPLKKKEQPSIAEISPNIINPLMKKYNCDQLRKLCIYNSISINKGSKKTLITKLLNNNVII